MADIHFEVSGNYMPAIDSISRSKISLADICDSRRYTYYKPGCYFIKISPAVGGKARKK